MKQSFLPIEIIEALKNEVENDVYELRFRLNRPILVNKKGIYYEIGKKGLSLKLTEPYFANKEMLETILFKATAGSVYVYNEQMKEGFLTIPGGIRFGLTGEMVVEGGRVVRLKNISSLNIRFPHEVVNCSEKAFPFLVNGQTMLNTLIISPPGVGKTTLLRDLALQIYKYFPQKNVLILDERYEITGSFEGEAQFQIGQADVMLNVNKQLGFESGIRTMSPNIILTDEIGNKEDILSILYAYKCGVSVIATAHANHLDDLLNKSYFKQIIKKKIFQRYIILTKEPHIGFIEGVYDESFKKLNKEPYYATST